MVNISNKSDSERTAMASGRIYVSEACFAQLKSNQIKKGDVMAVAKLAGIQAAKQTGFVIPLCHTLNLSRVSVDLKLQEQSSTAKSDAEKKMGHSPFTVEITSLVSCNGKTGVEMEALHAVSVAALTVYDMCKAVDQHMVISGICLESKYGGKSDFIRSG